MKNIFLIALLFVSKICNCQITNDTVQINLLKANLDSINIVIENLGKVKANEKKKTEELSNLKDDLKKELDSLNKSMKEKQGILLKLDSLLKKSIRINDSINNDNKTKTTINTTLNNENKILIDSAQKLIKTLEDKTDSIDLIAKFSTKTATINYVFTYSKQYTILEDTLKKLCDSVKEATYQKISDIDTLESLIVIYKNYLVGTWTKTKVEKIKLKVSEGLLHEIIVTLNNGKIYRNDKQIIDLSRYAKKSKEIYLQCKNCDQLDTILLSQVLDYEPLNSYKDIAYTNTDLSLGVARGKNTEYLRESSSLNSYIDVAAFTDIKGLAGEANGLAQISLNSKFITNTNVTAGSFVIGNFIGLTGGFAKFDKDFKGTNFNIADSTVNRKDLLQRSAFNLGVRYNLLNYYQSPRDGNFINNVQLNLVYKFVGSQILIAQKKNSADISFDTTYKTVTHNQITFEPIIGLTRNSNFGTSLSIPVHFIQLKKSSFIKNDKNETWASPSINISYFSKRNPASKLFFRYIHWINLKEKVNSFFQLQLGFSTSIGSISKLQN